MIRPATAADLSAVAAIYDEILDHEAATVSYTNWQKGSYPTRATAERALKAGTLFVGEGEDGTLYGCVNLNHIQPEEYARLPWTIPAQGDEVLVIHTLCIPPSRSGRGHGREFVAFAEDYGRSVGSRVIRLDTYEGNLPALAMYPKLGYSYVGETEFFFEGFTREILKCFEKAL